MATVLFHAIPPYTKMSYLSVTTNVTYVPVLPTISITWTKQEMLLNSSTQAIVSIVPSLSGQSTAGKNDD